MYTLVHQSQILIIIHLNQNIHSDWCDVVLSFSSPACLINSRLLQAREWSGKKSWRSGKSQGILFWARENWNYNISDSMPLKAGRNISGQCDLSNVSFWKRRLKAATISVILYLFGQGKATEESGNFGNWCLWQPLNCIDNVGRNNM